jgi:hypothetical protein
MRCFNNVEKIASLEWTHRRCNIYVKVIGRLHTDADFSWLTVAAVGVLLAVNGLFMVLSPRAWFQLPSWIPGRGSLTEKRYGSGLGAIQVRMVGAVSLGVIVWVLHDSLLRPR